jgi:uncharacterized protein YndB with AHSA1/START domain
MRVALITTTLLFAGGVSAAASAVEVSREAVIDAAPGRVWQVMGAFCSISEWHPAIARCEELKVDGQPHRRLTTGDGAVFLEKLNDLDNDAMSYSYDIVESPLPVQGYSSTISVADEGGKAKVTWRSSFEPKGVSGDEAGKIIGGIYDAGLASLATKVKP